MDLGTIQDVLGDFVTFGKNIDTALQAIPGLLESIIEFIDGGASSAFDDTSSVLEASSVADADAGE